MEDKEVDESVDIYDDKYQGDRVAWKVLPNFKLMREVRNPQGLDEDDDDEEVDQDDDDNEGDEDNEEEDDNGEEDDNHDNDMEGGKDDDMERNKDVSRILIYIIETEMLIII